MMDSEKNIEVITEAYPTVEHFYTLQGEGAYAGHAAYFIRLAGCDVGCVWCDTKESWDVNSHLNVSVDELLQAALQHPCRTVVITGGEPTMHHLGTLTKKFKEAGFRTHLETSGTNLIYGDFDWITVSPKKFKPALKEALAMAQELKIVIFHPSDLEWAEGYIDTVPDDCALYLQPEWSRHEEMQKLAIDYIEKNPKWRLSLQTHKFLNIR